MGKIWWVDPMMTNHQSAWIRWRNRYRGKVVCLLIFAAILNAVLSFWGEWLTFSICIIGHFFFGQAIRAFLYDKDMTFGPGGASMEDGPAARSIAIIFAILGYFAMFFYFLPPSWGE